MVSAELSSYISIKNLSQTLSHDSEGPHYQASIPCNWDSKSLLDPSSWKHLTATCCWPGSHRAGMGLSCQHVSQGFTAGLIRCNFNSCQFVSPMGQQVGVSPALSYTCFQLGPLNPSCHNDCGKASTDINRRNKAFCSADSRVAQLLFW